MWVGGADFEVIIWGASHKGMRPYLWAEMTYVKILIWQLKEV